MFNPRVIIMVILVGFGLFVIANSDTTPEPDVTSYSSSAHDYAVPLPVRVAPVNPDTVPEPEDTITAEDGSEVSSDFYSTDESDSDSVKPGDDNGDGVIDEDESGWDCRTMGNGECGEGAMIVAEDGSTVPASFYDN